MSTSVYLASRDALRERIMSRIDFSRKVEDKEVLDLIDDHITSSVPAMLENLSVEEKKKLRQDLFHSIRRLDVLQELVEDPQITEIMVNGPNSIFIEKAGELRPCKAVFSSMGKLEDVIQQIVGECGPASGRSERSDPDDPPFSAKADHNGGPPSFRIHF